MNKNYLYFDGLCWITKLSLDKILAYLIYSTQLLVAGWLITAIGNHNLAPLMLIAVPALFHVNCN